MAGCDDDVIPNHEDDDVDPRVQIQLDQMNECSEDLNNVTSELKFVKDNYELLMKRMKYWLRQYYLKHEASVEKARNYLNELFQFKCISDSCLSDIIEFESSEVALGECKNVCSKIENELMSFDKKGNMDTYVEQLNMLNYTNSQIDSWIKRKDELRILSEKSINELKIMYNSLSKYKNISTKKSHKGIIFFMKKLEFTKKLKEVLLYISGLNEAVLILNKTYDQLLKNIAILANDISYNVDTETEDNNNNNKVVLDTLKNQRKSIIEIIENYKTSEFSLNDSASNDDSSVLNYVCTNAASSLQNMELDNTSYENEKIININSVCEDSKVHTDLNKNEDLKTAEISQVCKNIENKCEEKDLKYSKNLTAHPDAATNNTDDNNEHKLEMYQPINRDSVCSVEVDYSSMTENNCLSGNKDGASTNSISRAKSLDQALDDSTKNSSRMAINGSQCNVDNLKDKNCNTKQSKFSDNDELAHSIPDTLTKLEGSKKINCENVKKNISDADKSSGLPSSDKSRIKGHSYSKSHSDAPKHKQIVKLNSNNLCLLRLNYFGDILGRTDYFQNILNENDYQTFKMNLDIGTLGLDYKIINNTHLCAALCLRKLEHDPEVPKLEPLFNDTDSSS